MKQLLSEKLKLPFVYFITDREEIKKIPPGIPYIFGDEKHKEYFIKILEYEVLYQSALKTGLPFNFRDILIKNGYCLQDYDFEIPSLYINNSTDFELSTDIDPEFKCSNSELTISDYIKDGSYYVNIDVLKNLNVFPKWLDTLEESLKSNIADFILFNHNMYNKKLEGMYGDIEFTSPKKNLIIIDISGSIPKACSSTCLTLSKFMCESFYADLLITGTKSTLYTYEEIPYLNLDDIYKENGMNNDQYYFKKLITEQEKHYETVIAFGDNHTWLDSWQNCKAIPYDKGMKMSKWTANKVISLHVSSNKDIVGYGNCFSPKEVVHISDWTRQLV